MSHRRYVFRKGEWVELDLDAPLPPRRSPYIMGDIGGYRSVITGEPITSRSTHREHLRVHGCIEIGNEMPQPTRAELPPVRDDLERAFQASHETHAEAQAAVERAGKAEIPAGGAL